MTTAIVNGAPMTYPLGTNDVSARTLVPEAEVLPTHLPLVYVYAKEGPIDPQLVVGNSRAIMYGEDTFDLRKPWATHATVLSNTINAASNAQMIQRLLPADIAPKSNLRVYLDVLPTKVPEFLRNDDGSYQLDATGLPLASGQLIDGYKVKWIVAHIALGSEGEDLFGQGTQVNGDQVDLDTGVQSKRYPWFDLEVSHYGSYGNNVGIRMWAPTVNSSPAVADRLLSKEKVYPFMVACLRRTDVSTTPKAVPTLAAEQYISRCWKPDALDRMTDNEIYFGSQFLNQWNDINPTNGFSPVYGPFGRQHVYEANVDKLINDFYAAEFPFADEFSDFTGESDEAYRFNVLGGVSSQGVPYHSFQIVADGSASVRFTANTNVFATGGSDGTMTTELFGGLVAEAISEFADESSPLQDDAKYPVSIVYDSGFPLATKYALCKFIAVRKDTVVVLSTHDVLGTSLTASEESSLAVALRTRLQMYPESDYFGTSTMRGVIMGRSGILLNSQYKKRLPLTIELAHKLAQYMGAGNGKWDPKKSFDEDPNNQINLFSDINVTWTPAKVKNKDWNNGLIWVENSGRRTVYIPAVKTVYDDDTSVLTSLATVMGCVEMQKVGQRARRKFSGNTKRTRPQLVSDVNQFVRDNSSPSRFDDRFLIIPDTYFTAADEAAGYRWTLRIKLGANTMKTVQTLFIESYRLEDLQAE